MPPPLPRCSGRAYSSLISPDHISLPRFGGRVGLHIDLFGACSAFTRVAACTLARSPIVTANRRLQPFRYLHDCSDCFRLERSAGWASHPLESAAFSRRTPIPAIRGAEIERQGSSGHSARRMKSRLLLLHQRIRLLTWPRGMSGMPQFFGKPAPGRFDAIIHHLSPSTTNPWPAPSSANRLPPSHQAFYGFQVS